MPRGVLSGLVRGVLVVAGVVGLTFVLLHLAPGDPATHLLGPNATPAQIAAAHHALGLDRSWPVQFADWVIAIGRGNLGTSIATGLPVSSMLAAAWPATAMLVAASLAVSYLLGIGIGAWQATRTNSHVDRAVTLVTVTLNAMPGYWFALLLVLLFTYRWRLLPAFGATSVDAEVLSASARAVDRARHIVLPLLTLSLIGAGGVARFVRTSMRQVHGAPFLLVARSKGISEFRTSARHQLRNALIPVITLLGLSLPAFFSGTVFVEAVFAWPGVGQLMVHGVQARDYPVVMAAATISALLVVSGNLLADVLVAVIDPRVRARGTHG